MTTLRKIGFVLQKSTSYHPPPITISINKFHQPTILSTQDTTVNSQSRELQADGEQREKVGGLPAISQPRCGTSRCLPSVSLDRDTYPHNTRAEMERTEKRSPRSSDNVRSECLAEYNGHDYEG